MFKDSKKYRPTGNVARCFPFGHALTVTKITKRRRERGENLEGKLDTNEGRRIVATRGVWRNAYRLYDALEKNGERVRERERDANERRRIGGERSFPLFPLRSVRLLLLPSLPPSLSLSLSRARRREPNGESEGAERTKHAQDEAARGMGRRNAG